MHCRLAQANHDVIPEEERRQYENAIADFLTLRSAFD
jgi:hypothetical protein